MLVFRDFAAFFEETGVVIDWRRLAKLGIPCQFLDGIYARDELPMVREFCKKFSGWHLVSSMNMVLTVNREAPNALHYRIADGNDDPELVLMTSLLPFAAAMRRL